MPRITEKQLHSIIDRIAAGEYIDHIAAECGVDPKRLAASIERSSYMPPKEISPARPKPAVPKCTGCGWRNGTGTCVLPACFKGVRV